MIRPLEEVPVSYQLFSENCFPTLELREDTERKEREKGIERVSSEFQLSPQGEVLNENGKIPGYDGGYLFLHPSQFPLFNKRFSNSCMEAYAPSSFLGFKDTIASHLFYQDQALDEGKPEENTHLAFGSYIQLITKEGPSKEDWHFYIQKRPENAFHRPGTWNATGAAFPSDMKGDIFTQMQQKVHNKYGVKGESSLHPLACFFDNSYAIILPSAISELPSGAVPNQGGIHSYSLSELEKFLRKHPLEEWDYPGFYALALSAEALEGRGRFERILTETQERLKSHPLQLKSDLESLGVKL